MGTISSTPQSEEKSIGMKRKRTNFIQKLLIDLYLAITS
jgi:hypothetical protein